MTLDSTLRN